MVTPKEIAIELMKAIQPKLDSMQKQIDDMDKKIAGFEGRIQSLNSVLMNKRKHGKE